MACFMGRRSKVVRTATTGPSSRSPRPARKAPFTASQERRRATVCRPNRGANGNNFGTVFKITTSGALKGLHGFGGGNDDQNPLAGLTNVNGVLYGTTFGGPNGNTGAAFKITTSGVKSGLCIFSGRDGAEPEAPLTVVKGVLYGTTSKGGADKLGTVFSLSV